MKNTQTKECKGKFRIETIIFFENCTFTEKSIGVKSVLKNS